MQRERGKKGRKEKFRTSSNDVQTSALFKTRYRFMVGWCFIAMPASLAIFWQVAINTMKYEKVIFRLCIEDH